jgi:hypothetical protein
MSLAHYALALCALLGTLLIPVLILLRVLVLKRRAIRVTAQPHRTPR